MFREEKTSNVGGERRSSTLCLQWFSGFPARLRCIEWSATVYIPHSCLGLPSATVPVMTGRNEMLVQL